MLAFLALAFQAGPQIQALPGGIQAFRDIPYAAGHPRQQLDLFLPESGEKRPLVLMIHGGGFMGGDKRNTDPRPWLEAGFAAASTNYRLSGHAPFPAAIEDVRSAIRWLRANAAERGYDPDRIAVFGASAGGSLAALAGSLNGSSLFLTKDSAGASSDVQAVVDFFGPTDFLQMDRQRLPNGMVHDGPDSPESRYLGGPIQERKDLANAASPITHITRSSPPFFIAHGDQDLLVPYGQSVLLASALAEKGVGFVFRPVLNEGHGFRTQEPLRERSPGPDHSSRCSPERG